MSLIHNERTKLLATTANNVGTATIVAGVVTPLTAATYGLAGSGMGLFTLLVSVGWLSVGVGLHYAEGMTWLQLYVLVGIPMILLALGYGAMKLADHDRRVLDRKTQDH